MKQNGSVSYTVLYCSLPCNHDKTCSRPTLLALLPSQVRKTKSKANFKNDMPKKLVKVTGQEMNRYLFWVF